MSAVPLSAALVHLRPEDNIAVAARTLQPDQTFAFGGGTLTLSSRIGLGLERDGPGINYKDNWGSPHEGGVHFLFGDGAVRRLDFATDPNVIAALLTPSGGENVTLP